MLLLAMSLLSCIFPMFLLVVSLFSYIVPVFSLISARGERIFSKQMTEALRSERHKTLWARSENQQSYERSILLRLRKPCFICDKARAESVDDHATFPPEPHDMSKTERGDPSAHRLEETKE